MGDIPTETDELFITPWPYVHIWIPTLKPLDNIGAVVQIWGEIWHLGEAILRLN